MTPVPCSTTTHELANRFGGTKPLPVTESTVGVYASAWVPTTAEVHLLRSGDAGLSLVVDTNVPGHPTVSIKVMRVELTPG